MMKTNDDAITIAEDSLSAVLKQRFALTDIGVSLLIARGVRTVSDAGSFLFPRLSMLHSPFYLGKMHDAVARIRRAISGKEYVGIFSDSDIDGLTALAITSHLLTGAGVRLMCRYPVGEENYGLTRTIVDEFVREGVKLLITLDCGIRDCDEIAYAREQGLDCIVCDHHESGEALPDAIVINPKCDTGYPYRDLAGASVALKLSHALAVSYLPMYDRRYALVVADDIDGSVECIIVENGVCIARAPVERAAEFLVELNTVFHYNLTEIDPRWEQIARVEPFEQTIASHAINLNQSPRLTLLNALDLPENYPASLSDLAMELFFAMSFINPRKIKKLLDRWLPLAALGSIADVVPLLGESRIIVAKGLDLLAATEIPPLKLLAGECEPVDATSIAWQVAPLLNTPGRLGKSDLTADFLMSDDEMVCKAILVKIKRLNEERRRTVKDHVDESIRGIENGSHPQTKNIVYIQSESIGDGFTGLVAGRIADRVGKPAIVVSLAAGKEIVKGSGRSPDGVNFLSYVEPFEKEFDRFGGHAQAFGFSARVDTLDHIISKIDNALDGVSFVSQETVHDVAVEAIEELIPFFSNDYRWFAPFGSGNDDPLFLMGSIQSQSFSAFGNDKKHGKFMFRGGISAIGWNEAEKMKLVAHDDLRIVFRIEEDRYNRKMRLVLLDYISLANTAVNSDKK
jgi:single-stranded-DNA-specific exonuclease